MRQSFGILLNMPWSLLLIVAGMLSWPRRVALSNTPPALIIYVHSFWYRRSSGVRAMTLGNVVLLGPKPLPHDLEHELVHIKQNVRMPFVFPFLNQYQLCRYGYRNNKYEREAYEKAGNQYISRV